MSPPSPQAGDLGVMSHTEAILKFAKYLVSQKVSLFISNTCIIFTLPWAIFGQLSKMYHHLEWHCRYGNSGTHKSTCFARPDSCLHLGLTGLSGQPLLLARAKKLTAFLVLRAHKL